MITAISQRSWKYISGVFCAILFACIDRDWRILLGFALLIAFALLIDWFEDKARASTQKKS